MVRIIVRATALLGCLAVVVFCLALLGVVWVVEETEPPRSDAAPVGG